MKNILFLALLTLGCLALAQSQWKLLKAELSQYLIARSWESRKSADLGSVAKPWNWADFSALARLRWRDKKLYVMSSESGQALAFGPGHLTQSALPGSTGRVVIAGHNDSHFAFLQRAKIGDHLYLENIQGLEKTYKIEKIAVVDSRQTRIQNSSQDELILLTCYPFNSSGGHSPLRLVLQARAVGLERHDRTDQSKAISTARARALTQSRQELG